MSRRERKEDKYDIFFFPPIAGERVGGNAPHVGKMAREEGVEWRDSAAKATQRQTDPTTCPSVGDCGAHRTDIS
jgi:hypothetical protein